MIINIEEEIKKYRLSVVDEEELAKKKLSYIESNDRSFQAIEKNIEKICNNNKSFYEEYKNITEKNINYKDIEILNLKREIFILKEKERKFTSSLIKILDAIDWINRISKIFSNGAIEKTIFNANKTIKKELITLGIIPIENVGEFFDESIHCCIDIKEDNDKENNEITEVVRKGYIYGEKLLRAAEVIVIKNEKR